MAKHDREHAPAPASVPAVAAARRPAPPDLDVALIFLSDTETRAVPFEHDPTHGQVIKPHAQQICVDGRVWSHVGEDEHGRWTYRRL
jgi:hypothetical protein